MDGATDLKQRQKRRFGEAQDAPGAAVVGVVGAGTMGAGIAQLACRAGAQTLLYDPVAEALVAMVSSSS